MYKPKYALFYDFHTSPVIKGIGKNFDADAFADRLKKCGVDFVSFPARCNMGMAYYDTKIGIRHYGLDFDMFGEMVRACNERNIAVNAYFNGGISQEEARLHPHWRAQPENQPPISRVTPYIRTVCCNTPYREHLISMMLEVAQRYPVAGFFVDSLGAQSCYCEKCLERMVRENVNSLDKEQVFKFTRKNILEFAKEISQAIRSVNPDFLLYFNCLGYEEQAEISSYYDFECIPTKADCNYEYLPLMSRYMRTLGERPRLNMTGRFHLWGDFGGLRPEAAIRQELLTGLAQGLRPNIGDHMLPDGAFCEAAQLQAERIFKFLHEREGYFTDAKPLAEVAILYPKSHEEIRTAPEVRGALRMLEELHILFDVVSATGDWSKYKLLVMPDSAELNIDLAEKMREYLRAGGKVISSGVSGLIDGKYYLEDWQCQYLGECDFTPAYFPGENMLCNTYSSGVKLKSVEAENAAMLVRPLVNFAWDGTYSQYYNPPGDATEYPFLVQTDSVSHFSHRIFSGYKKNAVISLRKVFAKELKRLLPQPLIKADSLPQYVRTSICCQKERLLLHLLAHIPEQRGSECEIIEDDLIVAETVVKVKTTLNQAWLAPERIQLKVQRNGEYLDIFVPQFTGYALVSIE